MEQFRWLVFLAAYLVGAIPFGLIAGRLRGKDVRRFGSGNIGATNVFRVLGWVAGPVLVLDIGKGVAAAYMGALAFPDKPVLQILTGLAAIVGHNWSIFLRFGGGKGVATTGGVFLFLMPKLFGVAVLVFLAAVIVTRYVSLGSLLLGATLAVGSLLWRLPVPFVVTSWVVALFIVYQHRENIRRLLSGTESRFGEHVQVSRGADGQ